MSDAAIVIRDLVEALPILLRSHDLLPPDRPCGCPGCVKGRAALAHGRELLAQIEPEAQR